MFPVASGALTISDFQRACTSRPGPCEEHPVLQAYVGGALDMVAVLDEKTEYLGALYCRPTDELFDVAAMIRAMQSDTQAKPSDNAMLVLVRYLKDNGGCT